MDAFGENGGLWGGFEGWVGWGTGGFGSFDPYLTELLLEEDWEEVWGKWKRNGEILLSLFKEKQKKTGS